MTALLTLSCGAKYNTIYYLNFNKYRFLSCYSHLDDEGYNVTSTRQCIPRIPGTQHETRHLLENGLVCVVWVGYFVHAVSDEGDAGPGQPAGDGADAHVHHEAPHAANRLRMMARMVFGEERVAVGVVPCGQGPVELAAPQCEVG